MKPQKTLGIVLKRTNYSEADRILTVITPDYGKLSLIAKGVRHVKSKLAGGIELFSINGITFIKGRSGLDTLLSARLEKNYGNIIQDLNRTMLGYDLLKLLDKVTEDATETEYFNLLQLTLAALDDLSIPINLIDTWFWSCLIKLAGYQPNLTNDDLGIKLNEDQLYSFDYEAMTFKLTKTGKFSTKQIKFLRLLFSDSNPKLLSKIIGFNDLVEEVRPLINTMLKSHIRI